MRICPNCKKVLKDKESGHYVPPFGGEEGFFICEEVKDEDSRKHPQS